jgi:cell division protein FtsN
MTDKPSLYVVEKKEVIVLVVLFVLVTVLSFTLGVRYGESVGKKLAAEQEIAVKEQGGETSEAGSGTLGKNAAAVHNDEAGSLDKQTEGNKAAEKPETQKPSGEALSSGAKKNGEAVTHSPEDAAKHSLTTEGTHEAVDKSSDEYLLNALKDAGVEPPGGKAPQDAKLPENMKPVQAAAKSAVKAKSGSYVIQVGSHPTISEAEGQLHTLESRSVKAEILPPFKDKQGEWHRVVIGGFKTKREAEKEASGLKNQGSIASYFVWRLP